MNVDDELVVEYAVKQIINIINYYNNLQTCCDLIDCDEDVLKRLKQMREQIEALQQILFKSALRKISISDLYDANCVYILQYYLEVLSINLESELNLLVGELGFMSAIELDVFKQSKSYKRAEKLAMCLFFVNRMKESAERLSKIVDKLIQEALINSV